MVNNNRPTVLSIAGFDPSGGAGLLADIKAFEQLKCYGLGVSTALTVQNDVKFEKTKWIEWEFIKEQLQLLFERFPIAYVKIGIVENLMVLRQIINFILDQNKSAKIVLDPVLKSSTGFIFHKAPTDFQKLLKNIYLLTPNYPELALIAEQEKLEDQVSTISSITNLLLKGGHANDEKGIDRLYLKNAKHYSFAPSTSQVSEKHGSGCVLSSAITAHLAMGNSLPDACKKGKSYVEKYLGSTETLLGYHHL